MIYIFFLFSFLFCNYNPSALFEFKGFVVTDVDFFQSVGKRSWDGFDLNKKRAVLNSFLEKEIVFLEGLHTGLAESPLVFKKLLLRKKQLLINNAYEHFIARPKIDQEALFLNKKNLKKSIKTWHLLVGFSSSAKKTSSILSKEEAFSLISSIYDSISTSVSSGASLVDVFPGFAFKHSFDPSAKQNSGLIGWVDWGNTVSSFQSPLFSLLKNTLSKPVLTEYGYHLIFAEDIGFSDYYFYYDSLYTDLSYKVGLRSLSFDSLRAESLAFDSLIIKESGFKINVSFSKDLYNYIVSKKQKERLVSNKYSLVAWLETFNKKGVLLQYKKGVFGVGWLINKLKKTPSTRVPSFREYSDFSLFLQSLALEDLVLNFSKEKQIEKTTSFKRDFLENKKNILHNEYIGELLNSVYVDSLEVLNQYNRGVYNGEHLNPLRVVFSELRFGSFSEAQKALVEIESGGGFDFVSKKFKGVIKEPVPVGGGGVVGEAAFLLLPGEISDIIETPKGSFVIIRVERFLDEVPFSLGVVYKQIERKIIKNKQEDIKVSFLSNIIKRRNIKIDYGLLGL